MPAFTRPHQYELWADLSLQNKHLRRNNWLHWGVHVLLVVLLVLSTSRPLLAIRVDSFGKAELVGNVEPSNVPGPEEAEHVARLVSGHLLEVTSGSVARDLSKAYALMTSEFGRAYQAQVQNDTALAAIEKGNVRTVVTFDEKATKIRAEKDADGKVVRYFVQLFGTLEVFRADVLTAPLLSKDLLVRSTLLVVPRGPRTLNGLLVDFFEKQYVESVAAPTVSVNPLPSSSGGIQ